MMLRGRSWGQSRVAKSRWISFGVDEESYSEPQLHIDLQRIDNENKAPISSQVPQPREAADIMASPTAYISLAKSLPAPLQRFLARWPPAAIIATGAPTTEYQDRRPNPFRFQRSPDTGKWHNPVYSQRRQAQLVSMAREHGIEDLLPETRKGTEYKLAQRVEHGLRVKGTGVGQSVKGHLHERHMIARYALLLALGAMDADVAAGWRRKERGCSPCLASSRDGRRYVHRLLVLSAILTLAARPEEVAEVPQIDGRHLDAVCAHTLYHTVERPRTSTGSYTLGLLSLSCSILLSLDEQSRVT